MIAVFIRSIYRVVDLQEDFRSMAANEEAAFMVFEGPLIVVAAGAFTLFYLDRIFQGL